MAVTFGNHYSIVQNTSKITALSNKTQSVESENDSGFAIINI